jgi:long-chain fatty acid transport protein
MKTPQRIRTGLFFLAFVVCLLPARLAAEDFAFLEVGARAAALGGAFTARADDIYALWYNPAGLAFLKDVRIKTNVAFGDRAVEGAWPDGSRSYHSSVKEFLGSLALSWQPTRRVTLATGFFYPYSYEAMWSPNFGVISDCRQNRLRTSYWRTAVSVEIFKGFALSGSVDYVKSSLEWKHFVAPGEASITESRHDLRGDGWGFAAGLLWKIIPAIQVGARFQKAVPVDYAGDCIQVNYYLGTSAGLSDSLAGSPSVSAPANHFLAQDVIGHLTMPRELVIGAAFTPVWRWSAYVDLQWDRWSDFGDWIFEPAEPGTVPDYGTQGVPLGLQDTTHVKAGLEYRPSRRLAVRAGYAHLQSSVDEAHRTLVYPDLERNVYSLGFGYEGPLFSIYGGDERVSDLSFDIFVRYAAAVPGPSTYPGYELTYTSDRIVFGVGVGFIF